MKEPMGGGGEVVPISGGVGYVSVVGKNGLDAGDQ